MRCGGLNGTPFRGRRVRSAPGAGGSRKSSRWWWDDPSAYQPNALCGIAPCRAPRRDVSAADVIGMDRSAGSWPVNIILRLDRTLSMLMGSTAAVDAVKGIFSRHSKSNAKGMETGALAMSRLR
jgi:hypothetical protein